MDCERTRQSLLSATLIGIGVVSAAHAQPIPDGAATVVHRTEDGAETPLWTYRPDRAGAHAPVLIVMHGTKRNADDYRDAWVPHAEKLGVLLIVPQFTKKAWPSPWAYQQIGVFDADDQLTDATEWASQRLEEIFDSVVASNQLEAKGYYLYGHSAGGQFVHRMLLLGRGRRVLLGIPANPGWYTLPLLDKTYPEGLGGTPASEQSLTRAMQANVVLLLGGADNDPESRSLPRNDAAMRQGPHRFARGELFFRTLRQQARALEAKLAWRVRVVPGVGHSNSRMAPAAAKVIAEHMKARRGASSRNAVSNAETTSHSLSQRGQIEPVRQGHRM